MAANFSSSQHFSGEYDKIFDALMQAAMRCGFGVTLHDKSSGVIQAKTDFSMKSFGEKIHIQLNKDGFAAVKSECALPTQIISWGKNKKNVNRLLMMTTSVLNES